MAVRLASWWNSPLAGKQYSCEILGGGVALGYFSRCFPATFPGVSRSLFPMLYAPKDLETRAAVRIAHRNASDTLDSIPAQVSAPNLHTQPRTALDFLLWAHFPGRLQCAACGLATLLARWSPRRCPRGVHNMMRSCGETALIKYLQYLGVCAVSGTVSCPFTDVTRTFPSGSKTCFARVSDFQSPAVFVHSAI